MDSYYTIKDGDWCEEKSFLMMLDDMLPK